MKIEMRPGEEVHKEVRIGEVLSHEEEEEK
jgi:hypothetical protein